MIDTNGSSSKSPSNGGASFAMTEGSRTGPRPPSQADSGRRLVHTIVAALGWALFLYWWWIVLQRVDPGQVRFTGIFIAITFVVCVLVTIAWAIHNVRIWKQRGPRQRVPEGKHDWSRDRLGRHVLFAGGQEQIQAGPVVQVKLEVEGKVYRAQERLAPRNDGGGLAAERERIHGR